MDKKQREVSKYQAEQKALNKANRLLLGKEQAYCDRLFRAYQTHSTVRHSKSKADRRKTVDQTHGKCVTLSGDAAAKYLLADRLSTV